MTRNKDQIAFVPSGGSRYIAFNTKVKPFDNINIRKAIIAASNRNALRLTRGGAVLGDIANGWIPPNIPGFKEAGGLKQNTDLDFLANPTGDPAVAKKYMLAAKQQDPSLPIDANGKWTGEREAPHRRRRTPTRARRPLRSSRARSSTLGFKLNFRIVPQDTLYTKFCERAEVEDRGLPERRAGSRTSPTRSRCSTRRSTETTSSQQGNVNWPQLDVPGDQRRR